MRVFYLLCCLVLTACIFNDKRFVRKKIITNDIVISWFYYSYISDTSPDIITISRNGKETEVARAVNVITDVNFANNKIIIRLTPNRGYPATPGETKLNGAGFKIVIDSTALVSELALIPNGVKE